MNTTAPENSVQTVGRIAWTGAKVAYGAAVVNHIFSPCEQKPEYDDELVEGLGSVAESCHEQSVERANELRQYIDNSLKIKPGDKHYAESAGDICDALKMLSKAHSDVDGWPLDPAKREECLKIATWATKMLEVWEKIRLVRLKQQKVIQDEYLIEMGAKTRFEVWWEAVDFHYDRLFKYFLRFCIGYVAFSLVAAVLAQITMGDQGFEAVMTLLWGAKVK